VKILVHPECCQEVVELADLVGSTEFIIQQIANAPKGSSWVVGTEVHLVNRLAQAAQERDVQVRMLSDCQCLCTTMYRIDQSHMLWCLDQLAEGRVVNQISVHPKAAELARKALEKMLQLAPATGPTPITVD
jgi:quinolinate synthase